MTVTTRSPARMRTRWDPFGGFGDLHEQMSRMLTEAFPDVSRISVNAWSPPVDVEETDDAYLIEADIPGVPPDAVEVDVQGRELHIHGDIEESERKGVMKRQNRRTGSFDYRVALPGDVSSEACEASLDNGVLTLRLPKTSAAHRRRIPVQSRRGLATARNSKPAAQDKEK